MNALSLCYKGSLGNSLNYFFSISDLSLILHNSKTLWPSAEDCQHFKRLNLRAFYSTWLSVEAKDVR